MDAAESRDGGAINQNDDDRRERSNSRNNDEEEESSTGAGTALAVGAAAWLGAWLGASRYKFNDSDAKITQKAMADDLAPIKTTLLDLQRGMQAMGNQEKILSHPSLGQTSTGLLRSRLLMRADDINPNSGLSKLKILTYNVWFRKDLEMYKRMKALGDLIQQHSPEVICFQEVTPNIYDIFQQTSWWKAYRCSVSTEMSNLRRYFCMQLSKMPVKSFSCKPFSNSKMRRELCLTEIDVNAGKTLVVATSHLESPCPAPPKWDQMYSKERVAQAKEAVISLNKFPNVVFCGDMNWDDKLDGQFPLPDGWFDAWAELRPGEDGYTYDTKSNQMLSGNRELQKRLDRFFCNLQDYQISGIGMIGTEAIPGLSHCKEKRVKNAIKKLMLPVYPSDHYGLLLTICRK